jgi:hypothetical protein
LLALIAAIGIAATVVSAQSTNVVITATGLDGTTLTIYGRNFGSGQPAVFVDDAAVAVSQNSNTQITAATAALTKGVHLVKVVRDASDGGTAVSTVQVQ